MEPALRTTTDSDRVMTIWMDAPGRPVNTCSPQLLDELAAILDAIERDPPAGVIVASAKPRSFNAGADLTELRKLGPEPRAAYLAKGQVVLDRLSKLPVPTLAAINGDCLGGGFELALACTWRVAADTPALSIGAPEVKLGLVPAWGGTTRLPRLIGLRRALPLLLAGKTIPSGKAHEMGMVDEVVAPDGLLAAAARLAREPAAARPAKPADHAAVIPTLRRRVIEVARRRTLQKTLGHDPTPLRLLDVVAAGYDGGFDAGLRAEREAILELMEGSVHRNLLRNFFLRQGAKKQLARQLPSPPHEVKRVAVIGGGTMGSGIIHALVRAGMPVHLVEVDDAAVSAALKRVRAMLNREIAEGRLDEQAAGEAMSRVTHTTGWSGLESADLVIEAAFEDLGVKREVFSQLERRCRPDAVLATNTSSLHVADLARAVSADAGRVVGLHFFSPVPRMPLVEVVRAPQSGPEALATAAAVATRLGKTAVLVADAPGFLVNRLLFSYLAEAMTMAGEGTPIALIDRAMKQWGMPMGPFELLDEIGLDVAAAILRSLTPAAEVPEALRVAMERKWLGKKAGRGFYLHATTADRRARREGPVVNAELVIARPPAKEPVVEEAIPWRLVLPMVNQAAAALREGVVDSAETIDLAMLLGAGLAPFRGGLTRFADTVGIPEIVRRLHELVARHGPRFAADPLLIEMAARGGRFEQ